MSAHFLPADQFVIPVRAVRWTAPDDVEGGFSGASIWRGDTEAGPAYCLKRWPSDYPADRLRQIHHWMTAARDSGLTFVLPVFRTSSFDTVVESGGRVWDLTGWMPGVPASSAKLPEMCSALAALHRVWAGVERRTGPCPAIARRLALFDDWERAVSFDSFDTAPEPLRGPLRDGWQAVRNRIGRCRVDLGRWQTIELPLFPCHCDPHRDHFLFTGDRLTGLIDCGAMKVDSPAVDLARLFGDLNVEIAEGMKLYAAASPPVPVSDPLVRVLAETGLVGAVANWNLRLRGRKVIPNADAVANRLERLLNTFTQAG
jgi:Ser/Thr protein kinase RdoA (MazF antagonist)